MADYWTPLNTVTDEEFDEYLSTLESTLEEKLEHLPDHQMQFRYGSLGLSYPSERDDHHVVERTVYRNLLEGLDRVEDKPDLLRYARDEAKSPTSDISGPFGTFFDWLGAPFRSRKKLVLQEIFDEVKRELDEQKLN